MDLDTEFDKINNRHRVKMNWKALGTLESRYTYLHLEDLYKIIEWCSTINFGKTELLSARPPVLQTKLTEEVAKSPSIENQFKADALGNPVYVVVKFRIYSSSEGVSIWTQYRKN